MMRKPR